MPPSAGPSLSLSEWLVLCLVGEEPRHGFAIARLLGPGASLGQVWRVPKPVVYRALQRLEQLGYVQTTGVEPSTEGPVPALDRRDPGLPGGGVGLAGRPASHNRDVRSELLAKLALLDRARAAPWPPPWTRSASSLFRWSPRCGNVWPAFDRIRSHDRRVALGQRVGDGLRFLDAVRSAPAGHDAAAMTPAP